MKAQNMNVVLVPSDLNRITFQIFANSTQIIVQVVFNLFIDQAFSVFGAENDMGVYLG